MPKNENNNSTHPTEQDHRSGLKKFIDGFRPSIAGKKRAVRSWIILVVVIALLLSPLIFWATSNLK